MDIPTYEQPINLNALEDEVPDNPDNRSQLERMIRRTATHPVFIAGVVLSLYWYLQ